MEVTTSFSHSMAFSSDKAREKLRTLANTQQSIQSTSQWCLFHTKHAKDVVSVWNTQFMAANASPDVRLTLLYLANDILQLARPKMERHALYFSSFKAVLPGALGRVTKSRGDNVAKYGRVLDVWRQRNVYDEGTIRVFRGALNGPGGSVGTDSGSSASSVSHNGSATSHSSNATTSIAVPEPLQSVATKYAQLETTTKTFKTNYAKFHTSSTVVLKSDVESDIPQLLALGETLETEGNQIAMLRTKLATELRELAAELDDWQLLDQQKVQTVKNDKKALQAKVEAAEALRAQQQALNDADDDDMPVYEDEAEDDARAPDSDAENDPEALETGDLKRQKTDTTTSTAPVSNSALQSLNSILEQLS